MRLVLDTSVFIAALRSDAGASRRLLRGALEEQFVVLASTSLLIEYEAVATRPLHLAAAGLEPGDVVRLVDALAAMAEPVRFDFHWRPALPDADDDMVLETAVNGRADGVVTFNHKDFATGLARFGIAALRPAEALRMVEYPNAEK